MYQDKFVFSQLSSFLNPSKFNRLAAKYDGDKYVKHPTCWNQLLALMFGQLSNRESLRDLIVALEAHQSKCFHLGLGRKPIAKTTLATANQNRDYRIFEELAFYMMEQAQEKRAAPKNARPKHGKSVLLANYWVVLLRKTVALSR